MLKVLAFLKRKPGMSRDVFRDYYEQHHAKLGERYLIHAKRYFRRYVTLLSDPVSAAVEGFDYDVVTEVWFESQTTFEQTMLVLSAPDVAAIIAEDEERLFDRSRNRVVLVDECESDLGPHPY